MLQRFVCVLLICSFLLLPSAFAHPGNTDENGGHFDYSEGTYHYHHGYPAHYHGHNTCPYDFDDRTSENSGTSGYGESSQNTSAVKATPSPASTPTPAPKVQSNFGTVTPSIEQSIAFFNLQSIISGNNTCTKNPSPTSTSCPVGDSNVSVYDSSNLLNQSNVQQASSDDFIISISCILLILLIFILSLLHKSQKPSYHKRIHEDDLPPLKLPPIKHDESFPTIPPRQRPDCIVIHSPTPPAAPTPPAPAAPKSIPVKPPAPVISSPPPVIDPLPEYPFSLLPPIPPAGFNVADYYREHYPAVWGYISKHSSNPHKYVEYYHYLWGDLQKFHGNGLIFGTLSPYQQSLVRYFPVGHHVFLSSTKSKHYHAHPACYSLLTATPIEVDALAALGLQPCSKCVPIQN